MSYTEVESNSKLQYGLTIKRSRHVFTKYEFSYTTITVNAFSS